MKRVLSITVLCLGLNSCSNEEHAHVLDGGTVNPAPKDGAVKNNFAGAAKAEPPKSVDELEAQLSRHEGQKAFLNISNSGFGGLGGMRAANAESSQGGFGVARAVQESDVFKIGSQNSKLLFLLNNYRGLQVVSFADGAEKPKLIGRAESTGNWSRDMYFDEPNQRLVTLESVYNAASGNYRSNTRLLAYSVKTPEKPSIAQKIDLEGYTVDSRLVGDDLYDPLCQDSQ